MSSYHSNSPRTRWDVFLSFRGIDTRYTFTDHLYSALHRTGIRTFRDDPELRSGEVISDTLLQVIQESKTYIVVFSKNYASSLWCLDELVQILNCYKTMQRLVIPVFYNINPSVVGHQTGSFRKAFEKHQTRFDRNTLDKWRIALTTMGKLSGKVCINMSEADIIKEIVDEILLETNPKTLDVAKNPVGLDSRVKCITAMFSSGTQGAIRIGIYGMGGVGKTTLAKALYNQLLQGSFEGSSFLANTRETSGTTKGLISLQQQLINDVLKSNKIVEVHNVDQGTEIIRARISLIKVLVVIDDLDHRKQYDSLVGPFASGSIVIVTTRNEEILDAIEIEPLYRYMVKELDDAESLTLFTRHAFGNNKPNNTLMVFSRDILRHAGGLPLALEIFGSYLYKRPGVGWKSFTEKLQQRITNSTIQQRLVISLDALESDDPKLKKMFLDVACFFVGRVKQDVVKIMETYYSYADHNIDILKKRCLLTINSKDQLGMHDLLRDVGREISRNNSPDDPRKHSRLWASKDVINVLKSCKGTEAIEGIIFNRDSVESFSELSFAAETFRRMSKLRFLDISYVNLTGSFEQTLENLRWLQWYWCPLKYFPSEFYPQKLVVLVLHGSEMIQMHVPKVFENLKTLNMGYSLKLSTTPDFTKLPCLETLDFKSCRSLVEVHMSIGSLVRLVSLNLYDCMSLTRLPDTICNLRALEVLNIGYCSSLKALPTELGNIESLKVLNAERLIIKKLPDSIGHLSKLVELRLMYNKNLETLPLTICNLRELEILYIGSCFSLKVLHKDLADIESLKELDASSLTISRLPDSIGYLSKLVELKLSYNYYLETLPNTICSLRLLEILNISACERLEILPDQLWKIPRLRELVTSTLPLLRKLPEIESSEIALSLEMLDLSQNVITALPSGIGQLLNLKNLILSHCHCLLSIPKLPSKLKQIVAYGCTSLKKMPNMSNLEQLEILDLGKCSDLTEIQGLKELSSLQALFMQSCNSSFLEYTLTKHLFQICSGFGHQTAIYIRAAEFPDWISQSPYWIGQSGNVRSAMTLDLPRNVPHNFLAMILCLQNLGSIEDYPTFYSIRNTRCNYIWRSKFLSKYNEVQIIIVPNSIFSIRDGDDRIEILTSTGQIFGIHLLYKTDIATIIEYDNSQVASFTSHPSKRLKYLASHKNCLSL